MNLYSKLRKLIYEKYLNLTNKNYLTDYNPYKLKTKKRALVYYKYSRSFTKAKIGTTEYQCLALAEAINKFGYLVTVVDRKTEFKVNHFYDIFIGAFNTGGFIHFNHILKQLNKKTKVIGFSTGANPNVMKKEFQKRVRMFEKRNKIKLNNISRFSSNNFDQIKKRMNFLIYFGYVNGFVDKSYSKFNQKFDLQPCISNKIKSAPKKITNKQELKNFVYYSGSGFLHKGLDLILEFFIKNPEYKLHICSPSYEKKFLNFYDIKKYENIIYEGNVKEDSSKAREIFSKCCFIISMNCSGGGSASLAVGRKYGLIPVVWQNEDCNPKASIIINKEKISEIKKKIELICKMSIKRFNMLSKQNYHIANENSNLYYSNKLKKIFKKIAI